MEWRGNNKKRILRRLSTDMTREIEKSQVQAKLFHCFHLHGKISSL